MAAGKSIKGHSPGPSATAGVGAEAPSRDPLVGIWNFHLSPYPIAYLICQNGIE